MLHPNRRLFAVLNLLLLMSAVSFAQGNVYPRQRPESPSRPLTGRVEITDRLANPNCLPPMPGAFIPSNWSCRTGQRSDPLARDREIVATILAIYALQDCIADARNAVQATQLFPGL